MVVESTDLFEFEDSPFTGKLDRSPIRRVLTQGKVRSHSVVIIYILDQDSLQVSGPKYDDMVQALTPDGANNAFRVWVLPWRTIYRQYFLNTKCPCPSGEDIPVNCIAIKDQILWLFVCAASFNQLLCSPGGGWMVGCIEMKDPATVITQNDQYKQDFEARSWNRQEIRCDD